MKVGLSPRAERQLELAHRVAAPKLADALVVLAQVPRSGMLLLSDELHGRVLYRKLVRIRRGWSYQLVYEIRRDRVLVLSIDPAWKLHRAVREQ